VQDNLQSSVQWYLAWKTLHWQHHHYSFYSKDMNTFSLTCSKNIMVVFFVKIPIETQSKYFTLSTNWSTNYNAQEIIFNCHVVFNNLLLFSQSWQTTTCSSNAFFHLVLWIFMKYHSMNVNFFDSISLVHIVILPNVHILLIDCKTQAWFLLCPLVIKFELHQKTLLESLYQMGNLLCSVSIVH